MTPGARVPAGLNRVGRIVRFEARQLPKVTLRDAPVHALEVANTIVPMSPGELPPIQGLA